MPQCVCHVTMGHPAPLNLPVPPAAQLPGPVGAPGPAPQTTLDFDGLTHLPVRSCLPAAPRPPLQPPDSASAPPPAWSPLVSAPRLPLPPVERARPSSDPPPAGSLQSTHRLVELLPGEGQQRPTPPPPAASAPSSCPPTREAVAVVSWAPCPQPMARPSAPAPSTSPVSQWPNPATALPERTATPEVLTPPRAALSPVSQYLLSAALTNGQAPCRAPPAPGLATLLRPPASVGLRSRNPCLATIYRQTSNLSP